MRTAGILRSALVVAAVIALTLPSAYGQAGKRMRMYNPSSEITVKGKVEKVTRLEGKRATGGVHVTLKTDPVTYEVIIGPEWFLKQNNFRLSDGDQLEVTGAKFKHQGRYAILARRITANGKDLLLRNPNGIPQWLGKTPPPES